jgi:hypothetical protein
LKKDDRLIVIYFGFITGSAMPNLSDEYKKKERKWWYNAV